MTSTYKHKPNGSKSFHQQEVITCSSNSEHIAAPVWRVMNCTVTHSCEIKAWDVTSTYDYQRYNSHNFEHGNFTPLGITHWLKSKNCPLKTVLLKLPESYNILNTRKQWRCKCLVLCLCMHTQLSILSFVIQRYLYTNTHSL